MNKRYESLIGKKFGRLTVIEQVHNDNLQRRTWLCKCDCGKTKIVRTDRLSSGETRSCGCITRERIIAINKTGENFYTHRMSKTRLYKIWIDMKARCYNNAQWNYQWYGKQGIKICDEWKNDFVAFYKWSINNGYSQKLTIDRIDTRGDYKPLNCRWSTMHEQMRNTKRTILISHDGKTQCLKDWTDELKKNYRTVISRIHSGIGIYEALGFEEENR